MACYAHDFISENNYYASSNDAAGTLHANDYTFYVS